MFDDDEPDEPDYENANKGVFTSGGGRTRNMESPPAPPPSVQQGEDPEQVAKVERPSWRGTDGT